MSVLAACLHKAEWICQRCAQCAGCCECEPEFDAVHINSKEAALALAMWARRRRQDEQKRTL